MLKRGEGSMGGVMLNFTLLLLLTRTQRCACAVLVFDATSCCAARSGQETRPDVPSGTSLSVPLFKANIGERELLSFFISRHTATTSGRQRKQDFLLRPPPLGRALMRPRGRRLARVKAPTALKKPSGDKGGAKGERLG